MSASNHFDSQNPGFRLWEKGGGMPRSTPSHGSDEYNDYHNFDCYRSTRMPTEPDVTMTRPPPYAPPQNQTPPLFATPQQHIWPSMIATSSTYQSPILPAVPIQPPVSAISVGADVTTTGAKTTTLRRKLTDDERRLICLEAENNPAMTQTQIGGT